MVVLLRHSDQIIRGRTGPTCEPDAQFTSATDLLFRGLESADRPLWVVPSAGLPLSPAGPAKRFATADPGSQSGFHGQTPAQFNLPSSPTSSAASLFHQPMGG